MSSETAFDTNSPAQVLLKIVSVLWRTVCVPIHTLLAIMEPIANFLLGMLTVLGVCMSFAFKFLRPEFPFWTMLAVSLSFAVILMLYHAIMRLTSPK